MSSSSSESVDDLHMQEDEYSVSSSDLPFNSNAQIQESQHKTATKISEITQKVTSLIDKNSGKHGALFSDPIQVYDEMSQACSEMKSTWEEYRSDLASIEKDKEAQTLKDNNQFREVYMNLVTEAFADELDDLRHGKIQKDESMKKKKKSGDVNHSFNIVIPEERNSGDGNVDMDILADMLESGMVGWSPEEKELLLKDWKHGQSEGSAEVNVDDLTPHERRRNILFGK